MIIAFDGPDKAGKSTSAAALDHTGEARYNMTKDQYDVIVNERSDEATLVFAFDRIDWLTHMVYRLALPGYEWNDARVRTVFAAPEAHLVLKLHHPGMAARIDDELYKGDKIQQVNDMYWRIAEWLVETNEERDFTLFKSISVMQIKNDPSEGTYQAGLVEFSSPVNCPVQDLATGLPLHMDDTSFLELLRHEEQHRV